MVKYIPQDPMDIHPDVINKVELDTYPDVPPLIRQAIQAANSSLSHEALAIFNKIQNRLGDTGLVYGVKAEIHRILALTSPDPESSKTHMEQAIQSATFSVQLNPTLIRFSFLLLDLRFSYAYGDINVYHEVVRDCYKLLARNIMFRYPVEDCWDLELVYLTCEERVNLVKGQIQQLLVNCVDVIREKISSVWDNFHDKLSFHRVGIKDLKARFWYLENEITEALSFGKENGRWDFWGCCDIKFPSVEMFHEHFAKNHCGKLSSSHKLLMDLEVEPDWNYMIHFGIWKPVDVPVLLKIIERKETEKESPYPTFGLLPCDSSQWQRAEVYYRRWPLADDAKRATYLKKIQELLCLLRGDNVFSNDHLEKMIHYTMTKLRWNFPQLKDSDITLDKTHLCICCLGSSELIEIQKFLQKISDFSTCMQQTFIFEDEDPNEVLSYDIQKPDIRTRIGFLRKESLFLSFDCSTEQGCSLTLKTAMKFADPHTISIGQMRIPPNSDAFLRWLISDLTEEQEEVEVESSRREKNEVQRTQVAQIYKKFFFRCKRLYDKKFDLLIYQAALLDIRDVCLAEHLQRKEDTQQNHQYYKSVLQNWLAKESSEPLSWIQGTTNRVLVKALVDVISKADIPNEQTAEVPSAVSAMEFQQFSHPDVQNILSLPENGCIKAIAHLSRTTEVEIMLLDAEIRRTQIDTQKLKLENADLASGDYRVFLLPLLKTYCLERLLEKVQAYETGVE